MVIGGLKPDTIYSITVAAYTTKGDGARSKPKLVVTKGAGQYIIVYRTFVRAATKAAYSFSACG